MDNSACTYQDMGSQFYITEDDVKAGRTRAQATCNKLKALNKYVDVRVLTDPLEDVISRYSVVVLTDATLSDQIVVNQFCRQHGKKFLSGNVDGALTTVFVDNGPDHIVSDLDGEPPLRGMVSHISNAEQGIVTTHDETRHGLSTGMLVLHTCIYRELFYRYCSVLDIVYITSPSSPPSLLPLPAHLPPPLPLPSYRYVCHF